MEELTETLDSNGDVDIIYLYFKKAFDKVPRNAYSKNFGDMASEGKYIAG